MGLTAASMARAARLTVALVGGYAFTAGLIAVIGAGFPHLGMTKSEAATLGAITGLLAYAGVIVWAVSSARPVRSSIVIVAAAAGMILLAPQLAQG